MTTESRRLAKSLHTVRVIAQFARYIGREKRIRYPDVAIELALAELGYKFDDVDDAMMAQIRKAVGNP